MDVHREPVFHASSMQTIYLCYTVHCMSFGKAVIYTTGDDRQKNTSHVFKSDMREACLNVPVLHLSPLAFRYAHLNLFIPGSLALVPVDGPIGRQAESTSLPPTFICGFEWWDVARGICSGADHLEVMYHWNIISRTHMKTISLS